MCPVEKDSSILHNTQLCFYLRDFFLAFWVQFVYSVVENGSKYIVVISRAALKCVHGICEKELQNYFQLIADTVSDPSDPPD